MKKIASYIVLIMPELVACLLFLTIPVTSCDNSKERLMFHVPYIMSDEREKGIYFSSNYMQKAHYEIERVIPACEILDLNQDINTKSVFKFSNARKPDKTNNYSNEELIVIADTVNAIITTPIASDRIIERGYENSGSLSYQSVSDLISFPIYIFNASGNKQALLKTCNGSLIMVIEAKNENNEWKPIEYNTIQRSDDHASLVIPAGHFAFTRSTGFKGDFFTVCRVKLVNGDDSLYSNEFSMSIYKTQFATTLAEKR